MYCVYCKHAPCHEANPGFEEMANVGAALAQYLTNQRTLISHGSYCGGRVPTLKLEL